MLKCQIGNNFFKFYLFIYFIVTILLLIFTPFTAPEADLLFSKHSSIDVYLANYLYDIFGSKHIILRFPFFIISILSLILYYKISKRYLKNDFLRLSILIYMTIPGVFLSFIIVNYATIPIFLILLFIYSFYKENYILQFLSLFLLLFTNTAQFAVYISLIIFSIQFKKRYILAISIIMLLLSSLLNTYPIDGIPKGHITQLFGIYGVILSPLLFIAFIYAIYKIGIKKRYSILWYIVTIVFLISIILSLRQRVNITDFTPYIVISIPLIIKSFYDSLKVRLKIFHKKYILLCYFIVSVLLLETLLISLNYPIYKILNKKLYFIDQNIYIIAQKVNNIQKSDTKCIKIDKKRDLDLYKYYNINICN